MDSFAGESAQPIQNLKSIPGKGADFAGVGKTWVLVKNGDADTLRQGAPEAALLYQETPASQTKRENLKVTGLDAHAQRERGAGRPTKRQLRDIKKFTGNSY